MAFENPFSTRFVRPGAVAYKLSLGHDLAGLAVRFETIGRAGQIVGPHGSGKSTLLADLIRLWESKGERVLLIELHDGQRRLPTRLPDLARTETPTLIAVDGYEQLSRGAACGVRRFCRRHRLGLVVTTHCSMGLADLVRCAPSLSLVTRLVRDLLADTENPIADGDIRRSFHHHEGNVREVLFEMYDLCEASS